MTYTPWERRLIPVPVSALRPDPAVTTTSPKGYSQHDLDDIARTVPAVYDRLAAGNTPAQILAGRTSTNSHDRAVGQTYAHLFGAVPQAQVLAADLSEGTLDVVKGNHRVLAAQRIGAAYLPVEVRAQTAAELDRLSQSFQAAGGPEYQRLQDVHRQVDFGRTRASEPQTTRTPDRT